MHKIEAEIYSKLFWPVFSMLIENKVINQSIQLISCISYNLLMKFFSIKLLALAIYSITWSSPNKQSRQSYSLVIPSCSVVPQCPSICSPGWLICMVSLCSYILAEWVIIWKLCKQVSSLGQSINPDQANNLQSNSVWEIWGIILPSPLPKSNQSAIS